MRHCLMYHGGFERNFPNLKAGATTFQGTDGTEHPLAAVPPEVDGVRVSYMEKSGKKFAAVRVQQGKNDVVLKNELLHRSGAAHGTRQTLFAGADDHRRRADGARCSADIMAKNPEQRNELAKVRSSFSVTGQKK